MNVVILVDFDSSIYELDCISLFKGMVAAALAHAGSIPYVCLIYILIFKSGTVLFVFVI